MVICNLNKVIFNNNSKNTYYRYVLREITLKFHYLRELILNKQVWELPSPNDPLNKKYTKLLK